MDYGQYQIDNFLALLASPLGFGVILGVIALFVLAARFAVFKWFFVSAMIFVPSITSYDTNQSKSLISPFQQINDYGRPIAVACSLAIVCFSAMKQNSSRQKIIGQAAAAFFAFQICFDAVLFVNGAEARAALGAFVHLATFVALAYGVGRLLQTDADLRALLWSICLAGCVVAVGSLLQYASRPSTAILGGRFTGVTGNPNFAGLLFAITAAAAAVLIALPKQRFIYRLAAALIGGLAVFLLIWSGSRTSALALVVTLTLSFSAHLKRLGAISAAGAIVILLLFNFYSDSAPDTGVILRTDNSRAGVWSSMLGTYLAHPVLGLEVGDESVSGSENSYLQVAAKTGTVGLLPLLFALVMMARSVTNLRRESKMVEKHRLLCNYACGALIGLFLAANFEGFLAAVIGVGVSYTYLLFAITDYLTEKIETERVLLVPIEGQLGNEYNDFE